VIAGAYLVLASCVNVAQNLRRAAKGSRSVELGVQHVLVLNMRRLNLHASALNDAEYSLYTVSLDDLAESHATDDDDSKSHDDAYYDRLTVGLREARAWFRGRYSNVPVSDIDSVCLLLLPCGSRLNVLLDFEILSSELGPVRYFDGRTVLCCV
jgi:hypothetical protein